MKMSFSVTRLASGLRVATAEMPHMESACVGLWSLSGSRNEPARMNGIAHFVEHLVFKGTERRKAAQIMREVEGIGGSLNAFTEVDHTCYYAKAAAFHLPVLADVLVDMFCRPTFAPREVDREREVIEEEIVMYRENPGQHIDDLLGAAAWPHHAIGRPVTGTKESLAAIDRGRILQWFRRHYAARNALVTVAGRVRHGAVLECLGPVVDGFPAGARQRAPVYRPDASRKRRAPRVVHEVRPIEQSHFYVGFHCGGRLAEERFALKLLNVILGENMSSRLFQSLREDRGLCYSVQSDITALRETGLFSVYAAVEPENLGRALGLTLRELAKVARRPPSRRELRQALDYTIGMLRLSLESTTQQMMWLGECLMAHGRVIDPDLVCDRLAAVTPQEVSALAGRLFQSWNACLAVVGPEADAGQLRSRLTAFR